MTAAEEQELLERMEKALRGPGHDERRRALMQQITKQLTERINQVPGILTAETEKVRGSVESLLRDLMSSTSCREPDVRCSIDPSDPSVIKVSVTMQADSIVLTLPEVAHE